MTTVTEEEARTLDGQCRCAARYAAMQQGEFLYVHQHEAWLFADTPLRSASFRAIYQTGENHSGERYAFTVCPWCGHDLPTWATLLDAIDGEEGG